MDQKPKLQIILASNPCCHLMERRKNKKRHKCGRPGFARLEGGTARCLTHLEEQMDWIENQQRLRKGK